MSTTTFDNHSANDQDQNANVAYEQSAPTQVDDGAHSGDIDETPLQYQSDYVQPDTLHPTEQIHEYALNDYANVADSIDQQLYANQQYYYTDDGQYMQQQAEPYEQYETQQTLLHTDYQEQPEVCADSIIL